MRMARGSRNQKLAGDQGRARTRWRGFYVILFISILCYFIYIYEDKKFFNTVLQLFYNINLYFLLIKILLFYYKQNLLPNILIFFMIIMIYFNFIIIIIYFKFALLQLLISIIIIIIKFKSGHKQVILSLIWVSNLKNHKNNV